jgi:hypothetical protein
MDDFVHIPIRVPAAFAERIDNYWHEHRLMTRAATVRVLLTNALDMAEARVASRPPPRPEDPPGEVDADGKRAPVD